MLFTRNVIFNIGINLKHMIFNTFEDVIYFYQWNPRLVKVDKITFFVQQILLISLWLYKIFW